MAAFTGRHKQSQPTIPPTQLVILYFIQDQERHITTDIVEGQAQWYEKKVYENIEKKSLFSKLSSCNFLLKKLWDQVWKAVHKMQTNKNMRMFVQMFFTLVLLVLFIYFFGYPAISKFFQNEVFIKVSTEPKVCKIFVEYCNKNSNCLRREPT